MVWLKILEKILVWILEEYVFFFLFSETLRWLAILKEKIEVWQRWLLSQAKKRTWPGFRHKENNISEFQIAKNYTADWAHGAPSYSQAAWVPSSQRVPGQNWPFPSACVGAEVSSGAEPGHAASLGSGWPASQELGGWSHLVQMCLTDWFRWEVEEGTKVRSEARAGKGKARFRAAGRTRLCRAIQA